MVRINAVVCQSSWTQRNWVSAESTLLTDPPQPPVRAGISWLFSVQNQHWNEVESWNLKFSEEVENYQWFLKTRVKKTCLTSGSKRRTQRGRRAGVLSALSLRCSNKNIKSVLVLRSVLKFDCKIQKHYLVLSGCWCRPFPPPRVSKCLSPGKNSKSTNNKLFDGEKRIHFKKPIS